jgi:hypothetical protein
MLLTVCTASGGKWQAPWIHHTGPSHFSTTAVPPPPCADSYQCALTGASESSIIPRKCVQRTLKMAQAHRILLVVISNTTRVCMKGRARSKLLVSGAFVGRKTFLPEPHKRLLVCRGNLSEPGESRTAARYPAWPLQLLNRTVTAYLGLNPP